MLVFNTAFLHFPGSDCQGTRGYSLEYHPSLQWRHEHRVLSLENRSCSVDGGQLAGNVSEGSVVHFCFKHSYIRTNYDELHYERRRNCHSITCISGYRWGISVLHRT